MTGRYMMPAPKSEPPFDAPEMSSKIAPTRLMMSVKTSNSQIRYSVLTVDWCGSGISASMSW